MSRLKPIFLMVLWALAATRLAVLAQSEPYSGKVVAVMDGDTVEVLKDGKAVRIRLWGVDAPELKGQPFGKAAKQLSSSLAFGKTVTVKPHDTDRYGRTVAEIILPDGKNVGHVLAGHGLAWWYRRYAPNGKELETFERQAKERKAGLWADRDPIPPWEWRHSRPPHDKVSKTDHTESPVSATSVTCCKYCNKGKACGNNCISLDKECHKPKGCACEQ